MSERWLREFRKLGQLDPPDDLWLRIKEGPTRASLTQPPLAPRVAAGAVAFIVAVSGSILLWQVLLDPGESQPVATPSTAASPPENGVIAFASGSEVYVVEPEGTGLRSLGDFADTDGVALDPWEWSPDGTRIALVGTPFAPLQEGGANYDVYVMNADGSSLVNLTSTPADVASGASQLNPRWSPDGQEIAFDGDDGLYVISADGTSLKRVADGHQAAWSPDGASLAFQSSGGGIHVADSDGTREMPLTQDLELAELPAWSPDGTRLAFLGVQDGEKEVYIVGPDGSGLTKLTDAPTNDVGPPVWSPGGEELAFEGFDEGNWDIFVVDADGAYQRDLTNHPGDEISATWSPDGTRLAFVAGEAVRKDVRNVETFDVYIINPDGTGEERLTQGVAPDQRLVWQPLFQEPA